MRARVFFGIAALALAGCETAFVGEAPRGRYQLVEVDGRPLPHVNDAVGSCPVTIQAGHFDVDHIARRFEMAFDRTGPCAAAAVDAAERGSYLRRGGRLELEAAVPGGTARRLFATESGDAVSMDYDGLRLRFRQTVRPPRR